MTEDQYKTLCECCDNVLVASDSTFERMAITWLHVIREHPVFLRQYDDVFLSAAPLAIKILDNWRYALLDIARSVISTWKFFRQSRKNWCGFLPLGAPVDFVFVSHLLNSSQLSGDDDFYFGNVPLELIRHGKSVIIVLINHTDMPIVDLECRLATSTIPRIVISRLLSPREEFRIWRSTFKERVKLKNAAISEIPGLRRTILGKASIQATSPSTRASLRIAKLVGEVISHCQAQRVVTTYEGHSWERLVYATARESSPGISCIGYQHAAFFRLQHAAKRSLGSKFDPDQILCAGPVSLRQLRDGRKLLRVSFGILGSARSINVMPVKTSAVCLVLPEGYQCECLKLFSFSMLCAKACPSVKFVWRLHPIMSIREIMDRLQKLGHELPQNIEISTKNFSEDIARSRWALYRGSTAIISAASNKVIPIYLNQEDELSVDPLYEIESHRPSVNKVTQFVSSLSWSKWTDESENYCKKYYVEFSGSMLLEIENFKKEAT